MRVGKILKWSLLMLVGLYAAIYLFNRPFRAAPVVTDFEWISHRGVYQTYRTEDLDNDTCTATRIHPPTHALLENTLPSMAAAFDHGAHMIELDIHRTQDGELAVFHDWTVDCRTEGQGETRNHTLAQLQALDVGYGYTADGGASFPFRGQGVGLLPSLRQVLRAFPEGRFMINQKDRSAETTRLLAQVLADESASRRVCLNAIPELNHVFGELVDQACVMPGRVGIKRCLIDHLKTGWTGQLAQSCAGERLVLPDWTATRLVWGWPGTFIERVHASGGKVYIWSNDPERVPALRALGIDGILTDRIELMPTGSST
ncbi:MAG: glycerophosphodiester phosphodiesterase family protein [Lysobacterales bacterium]